MSTSNVDNDHEMTLPHETDDESSALSFNDDESPSDEGSPDHRDEEPPSLDLRLYRILNDFEQYQGTFAFSSTYSAVPNPGLEVKGLEGPCLRLPVSSEDAAKISALGTVSPFGKGEQTIINPEVRSSRQLDPSQLEIRNPEFLDWLRSQVLGEINTALGIDTEMRPRLSLYKLLVYEKGDHFRAHRDTPKEDGMIGTVVIVLPSVFEGGIVRLSHAGEQKSFDFAPDCKYNFGVAAWYSDVEHAVDKLTDGYRVALVYNLVVEGGALSADGAAVKPNLLEVLGELRDQVSPVAYALQNKYSLAQRRLGFKGKDRFIISNLIAGINKIGGISMCCGDVQVKLSEDEDEADADDNSEDNLPPDFYRSRGLNGYIDITLTSIEHVAGTYRHFDAGQIQWRNKLYSLGTSLEDMESINQEEEYTGNEGTLIHTWYKTSCIILWPTSEAISIAQQVKEPLLPWESVLKIVTARTTSLSGTQSEMDALKFTKLSALIERCICFPPPEDQIRRAGEIVHDMHQSLPQEFLKKIEEDVILEASNLVDPWKLALRGSESLPNPSRDGLLRVLRLKTLFPKNLSFSFDPTVLSLLETSTVKLNGSTLLKFLEAYQESPQEEVLKFLNSAFKAHPNPSLLQDLYKTVEDNTTEGSLVRNMLKTMPLYGFHELIIAGLKVRFDWLHASSRDDKYQDAPVIPNDEYRIGGHSRRHMDSIIRDMAWRGTDVNNALNRVTSYLMLLDEQPEPHRSHLIQLLIEAVSIPVENLVPASQDDIHRWRRHLNVNAQVVEKLVHAPSLMNMACASTMRENIVEAIIKYFPPIKPEPSSYYLPAWNSPQCSTGTGCEICGPINQFLQSSTECHYQVSVDEEESDHYRRIEFEFSTFPTSQVARVYEYKAEVIARYQASYTSSRAHFTITKLAEERYRKAKRHYDTNLQARKGMLKAIGEPFNQFGKIKREVGDSFVPVTESEDESGNHEKTGYETQGSFNEDFISPADLDENVYGNSDEDPEGDLYMGPFDF
ncbi:hypothetical protein TWF730_009190 [Orbilia blumenaviensis]|uniref:Fe2OG dioxygenase domain-containing protein n=1 Tax=Orbilia blumenaviensis TaxID=1796055 RepID=A0AAV9UXK9_9PEZI